MTDEIRNTGDYAEENESATKKEGMISRRKLLASIGMMGAAYAAGNLLQGSVMASPGSNKDTSVTDSVYGNDMRTNAIGERQPWIEALNNGEILITTTIAELRMVTEAREHLVFYVTDSGREGCFYYDPTDLLSADDNGITIVASAGARFKRMFSGSLNIRWFGAKGDDAADDTAAIQQAINTAQLKGHGVYVPSGHYLVSAPIMIASDGAPIRMAGDGVYLSLFKPHPQFTENAPLEVVFKFTDSRVANRFEFTEFGIVSGTIHDPKRMKYGLYAAKLSHTLFRKLCIQGTQLAALGIGYGWCNDVETCELSFNSGDGLLFTAGQVNALNVINTKIFGNGGIGIHMAHESLEARIQGCTIEKNEQCGIYVKKGAFNLGIHNCYFENNGASGLAFTNPAISLKACIILNGNVSAAEPEAIQGRYPSRNVTVSDNFVSVKQEEVFVAGYAAEIGLEIRKNTFIYSGPNRNFTVLRTGTNKTGLGTNINGITMRDNDVTSSYRPYLNIVPLQVDDMVLADMPTFHNADIRYTPKVNYAPALEQFQKVRDFGMPGTFAAADHSYRMHSVYSYTGARTPDQWGFYIQAEDYPELAGKYLYFGMYIKQSHSGMNAQLFITGNGANTQGYANSTDWRIISSVFRMPDSGSIKLSVGMIADQASKQLYIAHPVLSEVGAPFEHY
ncbi:glycosyl hydrolase family 28-related protein [Paenibacillus chungangensis]|uniref:Glycosyl hydrolase family 28-related protein n=1 Tax=Paenibacillus chungangensis TaxID=696535 RepID=A0ABW3HSF2_9BACL